MSPGGAWALPGLALPHTPPEPSTHLSLLLLQLQLRLLHFVDKHLPHLFLLPLELAQELLPLGLVCFLEAVETQREEAIKMGQMRLSMKQFLWLDLRKALL